MVEARVRMFVGIGTGMLAILSFMVLTRNDGLGKFVHGDQRQNGFTAAASTSISESKSLGCFARDTVYFVPCNGKSIRVEIKVARFKNASTRRKMLLLLPGWNFADTQWCTRKGTPEDPIKTVDGGVYHKSLMLPIPSYVMGLSTGARGALLLALEHPEAFVGCAGLSGDYNPLLMKNDNLMINCLGKYDDVPWRWQGTNNIELRINELQIPCYIAHGEADQVVPMQQSQQLSEAHESEISRRASKNSTKMASMKLVIVKNGVHNYGFWGEQGLLAIDFFDNDLKNSTIVK